MTRRTWAAAMVAMAAATAALAQFEPPTQAQGPRLASVTAAPPPGAYSNTAGIQLKGPAGAEIHYTLDGSKPTGKSPKLAPGEQLFVTGVYEGERGLHTAYTIRAAATQAGHTDSDPATFVYTVDRRDRTAYVSEEVAPGVRMIRDSDNDKMFLIRGAKTWALIDTGLGHGALRDYVARFTGGAPLVLILTHFHGDHVGQAGQFIAGATAYVGAPDRELVAQQLARQGAPAAAIAANLKAVDDGARIDLGDRQLEIRMVPGHTPGSIAILDPATGNLFTGDTFGNNSPLPPDVMWLQGDKEPLDRYLANVRAARAAFGGRVKRIMTGHNDRPLEGTAYLDNLEKAIQRGLDEGEATLIPSWRPQGIVQLVEGDRFADPNWFGANVNPATFLPAPPDRIAGLTGIALRGATLGTRFMPDVHEYEATPTSKRVSVAAWPTSSRSRRFTIDGRPARAGVALPIVPGRETVIAVTAPDGATIARYRLRLSASR